MREFARKRNQLIKSGLNTTAAPQKNTVRDISAAAGTAFNHDFSRIPVHAPRTIQPKLIIGATGDAYEREADRIAEQVLENPADTAVTKTPLVIQRFSKEANGPMNVAPTDVERVLAESGDPLETSLRRDMEGRFGHDFSHVRIHTNSRAAESARAVDSLAYTVGSDVVFGAGQFSPHSAEGKPLLAHELTHVVQQTTANSPRSLLQRAPDEKKKEKQEKRRDVVIVGEGWAGASNLARVVSPGALIIKAASVDKVATRLGKINFLVGTVFFVTHSTNQGELQFGDAEGFVKPGVIAGKLQGAIPEDKAPLGVDFRGCSVGSTPAAMEQMRTALAAKTVLAGTCYAVINRSFPLKINNKDVTRASHVSKGSEKVFEEMKQKTLRKFNENERKCILNKTDEGFFAAGGRFVSLFYNPKFIGGWVDGESVCYKDLSVDVVDPSNPSAAVKECKLIKIEQEEETPPEKRQYEGPTEVPQP
jgi:Domain of unknown function (DUF4157)